MSTIFTKIINGEIPCHKIAENENFIAFLDIMPLTKGHTLVVPKKEVDYIFDHEFDVLSEILPFSKKVAKAIEKVISCERIGISVIGLEVPHTHVHLLPINRVWDMNFANKKLELSQEEMSEIAQKIKNEFIS